MDKISIDEKLINSIQDNKFFKLPKQLQQIIGLWPYENTYSDKVRQAATYFILVTFYIPLGNGCRVWCGVNMDLCCENLLGLIYLTAVLMKLTFTKVFYNKLQAVFKILTKNWLTLTDPAERNIILKYAELGRLKSFGYFLYMILTGVTFLMAPMFPVFLDLINPLNESRKKMLAVRAEYIIDHDENFYRIYLHTIITTLLNVFIFAGIDGTFTVIAHQNFAMLATVKHRLQMVTKASTIEKKQDCFMLVKAIILHKESLEFNDVINSSYEIFFLGLNFFTVVFLSISAVVALRITDDFKIEDDIFELIRLIFLLIASLIHLFFFTWPGQLLLDHSHDLFISAYAIKWYNISSKGKKLLRIMMLRLTRFSATTAFGLFEMNFENYGLIIKTALSYITAVVSFRN